MESGQSAGRPSPAQVAIRVNDVRSNQAFHVDIPERCSVGELKKRISAVHEAQPDASTQRLVLYGKPLNDDNAIVHELIAAHSLDEGVTPSVHLVVQASRAAPDPATATSKTPRHPASPSGLMHRRAPGPAPEPPAPQWFSGDMPRATPPPATPAPATSADPVSDVTDAGATGQPRTSAPGHAAPHALVMHPIMAAAYNAAYEALTRGSAARPPACMHVVPMPLNVYPFPHGYGPPAFPPPAAFSVDPQACLLRQGGYTLTVGPPPTMLRARVPSWQRVRVLFGRNNNGDGAGAMDNPAQAALAAAHAAGLRDNGADGGGLPAGARVFRFNIRINVRKVVQALLLLAMFYIQLPMHKFAWILLFFVLSTLQVHVHLRRLVSSLVGAAAAAGVPGPRSGEEGGAAPAADGDGAGGRPAAAQAPVAPQAPALAAVKAFGIALISFFACLLPQYTVDAADTEAIAAAQDDLQGREDGEDNNNQGLADPEPPAAVGAM